MEHLVQLGDAETSFFFFVVAIVATCQKYRGWHISNNKMSSHCSHGCKSEHPFIFSPLYFLYFLLYFLTLLFTSFFFHFTQKYTISVRSLD